MFYQPKDGHGLPHNPFNAIVSPRPIGWISTRDKNGQDNIAPYSFFNAVAYEPPQVMFASTGKKDDQQDSKDTVSNIQETGAFCVNVVGFSELHAMNLTSGDYPASEDEFTRANLEKTECQQISCPRIAHAPASLECKLTQIIRLPGANNFAVFGEVIGVHIRDDCVVDGHFDVTTYQPLARLGYRDYTHVTDVFSLERPEE
ncbi:flavin reductase family protein [Cochlodiniinecator piscidefendens]|uniref:flavin reductase family protein n=1 Tax=Cochlodiniinecator piscidefendens TaxID=2715756 RepID=UPI00140B0B30|nr:flavin reductase family protein [Cochlodiniinecator piscidefendens]